MSLKNKMKKLCFRMVRTLGRLFYRKHIWLVSDRQFCAGDNGEAFFKFLQNKPVNSVFAISKQSKDYERMSKIGKTVDYGSVAYKLLLCVCDAHISSQLIHMENHEETYQIFLQHGVIATDLSEMINPVSHQRFYIITTTKAEADSLGGNNYTILPDNVWLTGLPRHDILYNNPKQKITVSLTWRKNLIDMDTEHFLKSDYFQNYQRLLCNPELVEKLRSYGYTLCLQLHPEMERFKDVFQPAAGVEIWDAGYTDIFAESELLITDYSSIVFDFAQLHKPVLYYQFDEDVFWNGVHNYTKGYFDYRRDGFGEVVTEYAELEKVLLSYAENSCKLKELYRDRINEFFMFRDKNNSERVYQKIEGLLKK